MTLELEEILSRTGRQQQKVQAKEAELAVVRLNLAEMRLARKDVMAAEGQRRKSITKLITYQAFVGATPQDNLKLEV